MKQSLALITFLFAAPLAADWAEDGQRLVAALLGSTPLNADLQQLSDQIGGRPTGSPANDKAVEWALATFRAAGVDARVEAFEMPALWLEKSAHATLESIPGGPGDVLMKPRIAAMTYSIGGHHSGRLLDGGSGSEEDFSRLGSEVEGQWVLIETVELEDIAGLFAEYANGTAIEARAFAAGVGGVVYMGSRPRSVLYRHNASRGPANTHPLVVLERDAATRAIRLLRQGHELFFSVELDLERGDPYISRNVIGEIQGSETPEEFVVAGAHLDSWGLGTGALDNGCNVALLIDVARQIQRLGLEPRRTIRFALFNGEEQGLHGSRGYVETHQDELDRHVMASSFDIGSGRIVGFFTNGRAELIPLLEQSLQGVAGLGPFQHLNVPVVGTDNYDFMVQGVANLIANQESANYGPNYHARTDTFEKVDLEQLRLNSAIAAAAIWGFASLDVNWKRHHRSEIQTLIDSTDLADQMKMFGVWQSWLDGTRGRVDE